MKRSKLLGLAFMAILALTSITAATATAEELPNILPLGTEAEPLKSESSCGKSFFGSGITSVKSEKCEGTSSGESTQLGTFHTQFLETSSEVLGQCTGTGDNAGVVLALGDFHLKDADLLGKLIVAVLFLLNPKVTFTCAATTITVEGCVAGQLLNENELTTLLLIHLKVVSKVNEITSYLSTTGLPEFCLLLAKVGAAATALSSQEQDVHLTNFTVNGHPAEVLVMPL